MTNSEYDDLLKLIEGVVTLVEHQQEQIDGLTRVVGGLLNIAEKIAGEENDNGQTQGEN